MEIPKSKQNQGLVRQSQDLTVSKTQSLQVSAANLAAELKLTALNAKTDVDEFLVSEFTRALVDLPAEAVQAAFRGWRDVSPFFPAISDIRELCLLWVRRNAEEQLDAAVKQERAELEAARERGEIIQWHEVIEKFAAICERGTAEKLAEKVMPEVPPNAEIVITDDRREMIRQQIQDRESAVWKRRWRVNASRPPA